MKKPEIDWRAFFIGFVIVQIMNIIVFWIGIKR